MLYYTTLNISFKPVVFLDGGYSEEHSSLSGRDHAAPGHSPTPARPHTKDQWPSSWHWTHACHTGPPSFLPHHVTQLRARPGAAWHCHSNQLAPLLLSQDQNAHAQLGHFIARVVATFAGFQWISLLRVYAAAEERKWSNFFISQDFSHSIFKYTIRFILFILLNIYLIINLLNYYWSCHMYNPTIQGGNVIPCSWNSTQIQQGVCVNTA